MNKEHVTIFDDGSYGKDRRITKLVSDIKKLSEQRKENQVMKVTWKENYIDDNVEKWYECTAYDHDFSVGIENSAPSGLIVEKDGQGWIQQLELIDRWGYGHHWDNDMSEMVKYDFIQDGYYSEIKESEMLKDRLQMAQDLFNNQMVGKV